MVTGIFIVEQNTLLRESLVKLLNDCPQYDVAGSADRATDLLQEMKHCVSEIDVIILEAAYPEVSGIAAAKLIRNLYPRKRIILLTELEYPKVQPFIHKGVFHGYISKQCTPDDVVEGISRVAAGELVREEGCRYVPGRGLSKEDPNQILERLTFQERVVMEHIALGATSKEIALKLAISSKTVDSHRRAIAKKTGLKNAALITRFAIQNGMSRL